MPFGRGCINADILVNPLECFSRFVSIPVLSSSVNWIFVEIFFGYRIERFWKILGAFSILHARR